MKKLLFLIIVIGFTATGFGQIRDSWTETFNDQTSNIYGTSFTCTISGTWTCQDAGNFSYANTNMGSPAFTINDDKPGAQITTPALNTCGTVTFKYAYKNGNSTNVFVLQKSTDGTTFTDLDTHTLGTSSNLNYVSYSFNVNDNSPTLYLRVLSDDQNAHLFIEDFAVTDYSSGTAPDNPINFLASAVSTSEIDLSWTRNGDLDSVMVVWSPDQLIGTPADGTYYAVGDTIPGGDSVIYRGIDTTYAHTALVSGTMYFYQAFSLNSSSSYSSGVGDYATTYKDEPSNHVTAFATGTPTALSIPLSWSDNDGTVAADNYLIKINTTGTFTVPSDGTSEADDLDVSDGEGQVNVAHGLETYTWSNLSQGTQYYFIIYPYTNSGAAIDFKTDGTVPTTNGTTTTANTDLIISEVADPGDYYQGRFVELYNMGSDTIFFTSDTWYLSKQSNGGSFSDIQLTDTIPPGEAYVVAYDSAEFYTSYGFYPIQDNGSLTGNGDDGYFLYYGGDHTSGTLIDVYGVINQDGSGKDWEYTDSKAVRKRSVGSPNSTWTASEWVISSADTVNMTPGQHLNYVTWQGTTGSNWDTKTNWDNGFIPDVSMNVTIGSGTNDPDFTDTDAVCWDMNFAIGGNLTINPGGVLTVYNDLAGAKAGRALYTLTIKSDGSGQGALIVKGTASITASVENFVTTGKWHGISTPVNGMTANNLYLNGNPDVWMKYYNENDNTYSYITDLGTSLGDMKGWMTWVDDLSGTLSDTTFTLEGNLRSGTISPTESIGRSQAGDDYGFNFVGNPFTSTIDWDDTTGWTKTNLNDAIYVYNDTSFASYVGGTGTNGGSQYIAMNQGFFVQVANDGSTTGTLQATSDVCVAHSATFMKSSRADFDYSLIRLEVQANGITDETVVKLRDGATDGFDGSYDAYKMFSFNTDYPQIYSTANGGMSINTIPVETGYVDLDVKGKEGDLMTISATERTNLDEVWLVDELTGIQTDLTKQSYTFTYDNTVTDRFTLHFSIVGVNETQPTERQFTVYSSHQNVHVIIPENEQANIEIYNLLGQKVKEVNNRSGFTTFRLPGNQYYLVRVSNNKITETQKVLIQ